MSYATMRMESAADDAQARQTVRLLVAWVVWRMLASTALRIANWRARRRRIKQTITSLSGLSNRMLRDIGVEPGEIEQAAARACRG
jgi:uncharacterized protein YjiS (DUF1127 family)